MSTERHYPQLDGVRGLAIIMVLIGHLVPIAPLQQIVGWGDVGVVLFFCLSGFLITGIILRTRWDAGGRSLGKGLAVFYVRRALRIFPVYYLTVAVLALLGNVQVRDNLIRVLTYTLNPIPGLPMAQVGAVPHFWSLCVEEQFYLVWPLLLLLTPPRFLVGGMIAVGALSPIYTVLLGAFDGSYVWIFRPVFGCMDSLGAGGLLAYYTMIGGGKAARFRRWLRYVLPSAVVAMAGITLFKVLFDSDPWYRGHVMLGVMLFSSVAIVSCALIDFAIRGSMDWMGRCLSVAPLRWIGKVSYGIYVYHYFTLPVTDVLRRTHGVPRWLVAFGPVLSLGLTFLAAAASWYLLEVSVQRLKRHFVYQSEPVGGDSTSASSAPADS